MVAVERVTAVDAELAEGLNGLFDEGMRWSAENGRSFLADPDALLLVARIDGVPRGFLTAYRLPRVEGRSTATSSPGSTWVAKASSAPIRGPSSERHHCRCPSRSRSEVISAPPALGKVLMSYRRSLASQADRCDSTATLQRGRNRSSSRVWSGLLRVRTASPLASALTSAQRS